MSLKYCIAIDYVSSLYESNLAKIHRGEKIEILTSKKIFEFMKPDFND